MQRLLLHDDLAMPSALAALDCARPDIVEWLPSVTTLLLRDASRIRLRTVQRIEPLDSTGLETGLNSIVSPAPYAIAIAPAVAIPQVMPTIRVTTPTPVWGTGFITSADQASEVLSAGADVVSSSRPEVWLDFIRIPVRG